MPTSADFEKAKSRAKKTIQTRWRSIARSYTLGWGGPIDDVERDYPFIRSVTLSIHNQISADLPVVIFQSRESPPKDMIAAVPYCDDTGNPFNCRLAMVKTHTLEEERLCGEFAQAFWFCIHMRLLPHPAEVEEFQSAILKWTGEELFRI